MKKTAIIQLIVRFFSFNSKKGIIADYEVKKNETFEITLEDADGSVYDYKVNKNETFEITLIVSGGSGYHWEWIRRRSSKIVDYVGVTSFDPNPPGMCGGAIHKIWKFKGIETGVETLIFNCIRGRKDSIETKKVFVKVK